ncbi:hypothetical protein SAMN05444166_0227 [Singulisphaera sp. GP187]|uniref:hypothetical protein n=1 Tax=Singulisphaera sp. GP187 TaxID=1882752 RepID=UPI0009281168|nr:hypothetical protein [Singulisphaera sp. GP187]SIN70018.1 hypothetical protein SAMN05444166_0227 [Singulisphaera sp. GP187]
MSNSTGSISAYMAEREAIERQWNQAKERARVAELVADWTGEPVAPRNYGYADYKQAMAACEARHWIFRGFDPRMGHDLTTAPRIWRWIVHRVETIEHMLELEAHQDSGWGVENPQPYWNTLTTFYGISWTLLAGHLAPEPPWASMSESESRAKLQSIARDLQEADFSLGGESSIADPIADQMEIGLLRYILKKERDEFERTLQERGEQVAADAAAVLRAATNVLEGVAQDKLLPKVHQIRKREVGVGKTVAPAKTGTRALAAAYELVSAGKPVSVKAACERAGVDRKNIGKRWPEIVAAIAKLGQTDRLPHRATIDRRTGTIDGVVEIGE